MGKSCTIQTLAMAHMATMASKTHGVLHFSAYQTPPTQFHMKFSTLILILRNWSESWLVAYQCLDVAALVTTDQITSATLLSVTAVLKQSLQILQATLQL